MFQVFASMDVQASLDKTFHIFTDFQTSPQYIKGIQSLEILTPGVIGKGMRFRETRIMFGRPATEEMEITQFSPLQKITISAFSHGTQYHTTYTFSLLSENSTRVEMVFQGIPHTTFSKVMGKLCGWMMTGSLKQALMNDMKDLKQVAEGKGEKRG
jgi:hypothetical protein